MTDLTHLSDINPKVKKTQLSAPLISFEIAVLTSLYAAFAAPEFWEALSNSPGWALGMWLISGTMLLATSSILALFVYGLWRTIGNSYPRYIKVLLSVMAILVIFEGFTFATSLVVKSEITNINRKEQTAISPQSSSPSNYTSQKHNASRLISNSNPSIKPATLSARSATSPEAADAMAKKYMQAWKNNGSFYDLNGDFGHSIVLTDRILGEIYQSDQIAKAFRQIIRAEVAYDPDNTTHMMTNTRSLKCGTDISRNLNLVTAVQGKTYVTREKLYLMPVAERYKYYTFTEKDFNRWLHIETTKKVSSLIHDW
jgi:hypothetical protein